MSRYTNYFIGFVLAVITSSGSANAGASQCATDGVAISGYDLISYHNRDGPSMGVKQHAVSHEGSHYYFLNAANKALFEAKPDQYLPVYQGWCAATLAMGRLACPDYANFKVENGRLLFFELAGFTNGRTLWNSDPDGFRQRADDNASRLLSGR